MFKNDSTATNLEKLLDFVYALRSRIINFFSFAETEHTSEAMDETEYILQNENLMEQIRESELTHAKGQGYQPSAEEMNEILGL